MLSPVRMVTVFNPVAVRLAANVTRSSALLLARSSLLAVSTTNVGTLVNWNGT